MKKIKLISLIILITISNDFSQELFDGPQRELYLYGVNLPSYPPLYEVIDTLNTLSVLLCRAPRDNENGYLCSVCPQNSFVTITNLPTGNSGWNICNDDVGQFQYFGYSFYRMNNNKTGDYFYIDFRDCNYKPHGVGGFGYLSTDIIIKLNKNYDGNNHSRYEYTVSNQPIKPIANGDILRVWNLEHLSPPQPYIPKTDCFPDFWQNCLVLIPSPDNHPHLVWGPHPTFSATHYRIYRAVSNYPVNPSSLTYSLISTVSSSTFDFIDYAVTILPGYQYAYYYVVGWNGTSQSAKTNYVSTQAEFQKSLMDMPTDFGISQNYPNPFNPSTSISYSIPENAFVTLKIYDVLGNEVVELINEQKESGNYQIDFNASELSSGIYYYTLTEGNFTSTKKMILVK